MAKKIISGKVYDTDTAKKLGDWDNGYYTNDFNYCSETLYQKKTGEFFLHGEGHALSKYASHEGNMSGWGERIIPLTYDEACEWAENHLDADDYIAIFGEPEEDDSKVHVHFYLSSAAHKRAKTEAAKRGVSLGNYIESLIP